jgi:TATA-box binding protein (TBP) (component of TFIID and TFIIIB)
MLSHLNITDLDIQGILDIPEEEESTDIRPTIDSDIEKEMKDISYNLSTMTICGRLGGGVNISRVIEDIPIQPYWAIREGIIRIEGYRDNVAIYRGISRKYIEKRNVQVKPFRNSASIYCRIFDEETGTAKEPSVKLFRNGGFQVTGIRTPYQADKIVTFIKNTLRAIGGVFEEETEGFINVCMMNSDITLPYKINRGALQSILKDKGILSTFETTSYQGINIKYYWNYEKHRDGLFQNGVCECVHVCESSGKKRVMKNPDLCTQSGCVRITIAPFQTGKIIITGAKTVQQINDASSWILKVICDNHTDILMGKAVPKKKRKKIPFRSGHTIDIVR